MFLCCDRNIHDAILTGKIPENPRLRLVFSLGIFTGWNDVIHVSITAQRHSSNFLFVKRDMNDVTRNQKIFAKNLLFYKRNLYKIYL